MVPRSHFMHQGHALLQNNTKEYLCGGCKTDGNGMNFGCEPCSFHMHEFCSNCPMTLSSFFHPHPLSLMISDSTQYTPSPRICHVCEDTVEGLFYWCQTCNFNVHPICTQFPPFLYHAVLHYPHQLMFQISYKHAPCCVCGLVCNSWRYRCGYCDGFDVHVECLAKSFEAKSHDTTTRRLPPWAGLYTYGGVNSTANSYNNTYKPPRVNDQTTPSYNMYNPYNLYGTVPHGTYAHQTDNFYGEMPVGTNSGTHQNGLPCNTNPFNGTGTYAHQTNNFYGEMPVGTNSGTYQNGLPCNTNQYCSMYNPHNGAPFDSNSQHVQIHHGHTSCHQAPAHNAQTSPAQGHGFGKLGGKIFGIVSTLTLGVVSNFIFGAIS